MRSVPRLRLLMSKEVPMRISKHRYSQLIQFKNTIIPIKIRCMRWSVQVPLTKGFISGVNDSQLTNRILRSISPYLLVANTL